MYLSDTIKTLSIKELGISSNGFSISTSNLKKIEEIKKTSHIPISRGLDLPEIKSDCSLTVAIHKAIDFYNATLMEKTFIEDTIVEINGKPITDIKFVFSSLKEHIPEYLGKSVSIKTTMACVIQQKVLFIEHSVDGLIDYQNEDGFVFDPYFFVKYNDEYKSFAYLDSIGVKHLFNPRNKIVTIIEEFIQGHNKIQYIDIDSIPEWNGHYQS